MKELAAYWSKSPHEQGIIRDQIEQAEQEEMSKHREWTKEELREGYQSLPEREREHYVRYSGGPRTLPPLLDTYVRHPKLKLAPFSGK